MIKMFGFPDQEQQALLGKLANFPQQSPDDRWLVHLASAQAFRHENPGVRDALLCVPEGLEDLLPHDWAEHFIACVDPVSELDLGYLQQFSRCPRLPGWQQRVDAVPATWFAALKKGPEDLFVGEMPFPETDKNHLVECGLCREEVALWLEQRASLRRVLLCPDAEKLGNWLGGGADAELEHHVAECWHCQEIIQRQAPLYVAGDLITPQQKADKLQAVGLSPVPAPRPWLVAPVRLDPSRRLTGESANTAVELGWSLARFLGLTGRAGAAVRAATVHASRGARGPRDAGPGLALQDLADSVEANGYVRIPYAEREILWQAKCANDALEVRVGKGPAEPFLQFDVVFYNGDDERLSVKATDGVARLTRENLELLRREDCDRWNIILS